MTKPLIFTVAATLDEEASVWTGYSDAIPAATGAPTLDELLAKISAMAVDLLPDNCPGVDPDSVFCIPSRIPPMPSSGRRAFPRHSGSSKIVS